MLRPSVSALCADTHGVGAEPRLDSDKNPERSLMKYLLRKPPSRSAFVLCKNGFSKLRVGKR